MKRILLIVALLFVQSLCWAQTAENDPDPARFDGEIAQFQQWDAKNSYPEQAILFVGSSSIRMWETHEAFPEYPIINRGFGGSHISDVQHFYDQVIKKYNPSVILFYAGDNDVAADKPVEQVMADYKEITDRVLDDFPDVKFVYVPIKPSSSRWQYWSAMDAANQKIKAYNKMHSQLYYIDLATPLLGSDGTPDDSFFIDDQLHLNKSGYAVWNQIVAPKLGQWYQQK
jgi:lysophospholipase L1-like esterase